jgi:hypothetical protein
MSASGRNAAPKTRCTAAKLELRTKTMFSAATKFFDRAALSVFLMLAVTPMLAIAAAASIH